jgi:hypothetical protein
MIYSAVLDCAEVDDAYKQREAALEAYRQEVEGRQAEAKRSKRRVTAGAAAVAAS